ncbi:MAG: hypothetical protein UY01_C0006G0001 [Candidatus Nomurabacteria bacterium GW2011_GWB1_47_6]|uniref:Uncharacterized protein n=1 Tax=Candidatus Nomurabacteria bacterium GW2011_GWB1_47_6 TaxID=1618749 RepID=A0A0G1T1R4_9BACT|nr:MAG: hypothetical protein UY01_C0006G0001 [Candidatus Nomurabacteria bacterium GW2011_GWB1_47_6]
MMEHFQIENPESKENKISVRNIYNRNKNSQINFLAENL